MRRFGAKTREARQSWIGHVRGKDDGVYWEKDAEDGVARKRGRPNMRYMDAVREDMTVLK